MPNTHTKTPQKRLHYLLKCSKPWAIHIQGSLNLPIKTRLRIFLDRERESNLIGRWRSGIDEVDPLWQSLTGGEGALDHVSESG
jgi:hypothetical protein